MKRITLYLILFTTILALLLPACSALSSTSPTPVPTPLLATPTAYLPTVTLTAIPSVSMAEAQQPGSEEITFQSGAFKIVGDLRLPEGIGPFPVVLFVHGSGMADRIYFGEYLPIMERMLRAGYATFAWDKPGTGESTGTIELNTLIQQRTQIILDAIDVLKARPDIDKGQIGLWGVSQAGYVMPYAISISDDIAFMICVSCPGVPGDDQMAYQDSAFALCGSVPEGMADRKASLLAELDQARTFDTYAGYLHYREVLQALIDIFPGSHETRPVLSEKSWQENRPVIIFSWNPVEGIKQTKIPVLAIFGDRDRYIDSLQGAYAYQKALEQTGNPESHVEIFPKAEHHVTPAETGCPEEKQRLDKQHWKSLGFESPSAVQEALLKDPYRAGLMGDPYVPGYLDLIEAWLKSLHQ